MLKLFANRFAQPKDGWHTTGAGQWVFVVGPTLVEVQLLHGVITVNLADPASLRFARWQKTPRKSPPDILKPRIRSISTAISRLVTRHLVSVTSPALAAIHQPGPAGYLAAKAVVDAAHTHAGNR